jgi:hypothetical protein
MIPAMKVGLDIDSPGLGSSVGSSEIPPEIGILTNYGFVGRRDVRTRMKRPPVFQELRTTIVSAKRSCAH